MYCCRGALAVSLQAQLRELAEMLDPRAVFSYEARAGLGAKYPTLAET